MTWWGSVSSWWSGAGAVPNSTVGDPDSVGPGYRPGDPDGFELEAATGEVGERAAIVPSPWDGWPASWSSPAWGSLGPRVDDLVDTAWAALDLNASVLSAMPVYRTRDGQVLPPTAWMANPDPDIYSGWPEFAKQWFWDWQGTGEAFVLATARTADGWPYRFRVIPPWMVEPEMRAGRREYRIGSIDVTDDILHCRYKSTTDNARGVGPLSVAGPRMVAASVLTRYAADIAQGGGVPRLILETDAALTEGQANDLKERWWASRLNDLGEPWKPAVMSSGLKARLLQFSPKDMLLTDLGQQTEAKIANLLGVPPFLLGLPGGDSMTYSNATSLFDFHDRRYLKTAAVHMMTALSGWALPRGQAVELNRDEYSRPPLLERASAYEKLAALGALNSEEIRVMERLVDAPASDTDAADDGDVVAAEALTGGGRS